MTDEYAIVGDYGEQTGALISVCGSSYDVAEEALKKIISGAKPQPGYTNIRIERMFAEDCWWNE